MNENDNVILAITEQKMARLAQEIVMLYQETVEIITDAFPSLITGVMSRVRAALGSFRADDGIFTSNELLELANCMSDSEVELQSRIVEALRLLRVTRDYVEVYIANGVPSKEMDVRPKIIVQMIRDLSLDANLTEKFSAINIKAPGRLLENVKSYMGRKKVALEAEIRFALGPRGRLMHQLIQEIDDQETFAMSAEGKERHAALLLRARYLVTNFISYMK